jgi:DNA-directed RNA polymerase subunit RPC12/RpoP
MNKLRCAKCGKVFDNEYPDRDSVPDSEYRCENCEGKVK